MVSEDASPSVGMQRFHMLLFISVLLWLHDLRLGQLQKHRSADESHE